MVNVGGTVRFVCNSRSPVHWDFNENDIKLSTMSNFEIHDHNTTLVINDVNQLNVGYYYCQGETNELALKGLQIKYQIFYAKSPLWIRGEFSFGYSLAIWCCVFILLRCNISGTFPPNKGIRR